MSDRENSGDTTDASTPKAYYTLDLTFTKASGLISAIKTGVSGYSLQNGFLVVKTEDGESWYRASEILVLNKYYG